MAAAVVQIAYCLPVNRRSLPRTDLVTKITMRFRIFVRRIFLVIQAKCRRTPGPLDLGREPRCQEQRGFPTICPTIVLRQFVNALCPCVERYIYTLPEAFNLHNIFDPFFPAISSYKTGSAEGRIGPCLRCDNPSAAVELD